MLRGPVLGTCFFWALWNYNLGSDPGVSSRDCMNRSGWAICGECVCPSRGVFSLLSGEEMRMMMMMMVDENIETWKNNRQLLYKLRWLGSRDG